MAVVNVTSASFASPYFEITFGSHTLSPEETSLVTDVEIKDEIEEKDTATVSVNDPAFQFQKLAVKGVSVRIVAGFFMGKTKEFIGEVSGLTPQFPESGLPTLSVECSAKSKKGHESQENKSWKKMKRSEIAKKIAATRGWTSDVDETKEIVEQESQAGESDVDFLRKLARKENFIFRVKGNVMQFKKAPDLDNQSPVAVFDYRIGNHTVKSFSPRYASDETGKDIEAATINNKSKEIVKTKADSSVAKPQGTKDSGSVNRGKAETIYPSEKETARKS
jgi:phage protein D